MVVNFLKMHFCLYFCTEASEQNVLKSGNFLKTGISDECYGREIINHIIVFKSMDGSTNICSWDDLPLSHQQPQNLTVTCRLVVHGMAIYRMTTSHQIFEGTKRNCLRSGPLTLCIICCASKCIITLRSMMIWSQDTIIGLHLKFNCFSRNTFER